MAKSPNYDNLIGFKTPTQMQKTAQICMIQTDMQRIDSVLLLGKKAELKALHVELDGTYQNLIKNWGNSTYNYIVGHGYHYEYMDENTLRDNLTTMKGKLRGFLLQLSPNAEDVLSADTSLVKDSAVETKDVPDQPVVRPNMYDIVKGRKFDVAKEYARIWKLFNTADLVGPRATELSLYVDGNLQFFPDSFKRRALTLADFNDTYGFNFVAPGQGVTVDELVSYCEYVTTLCDFLWEYGSNSLDDDAEYLRDELFRTIESCMDEIGLVAAKKDGITIYIDKDSTVLAVAELVDETLAYDIKSFIHRQTRGNLERKKTILKFLADEIEPKRKILNANNLSGLGDLLFQMLQKFVRHNNEKNDYISNMSANELEACYDDTYQLWLLAILEIDNIERKRRVKKLLGEINSPTA